MLREFEAHCESAYMYYEPLLFSILLKPELLSSHGRFLYTKTLAKTYTICHELNLILIKLQAHTITYD